MRPRQAVIALPVALVFHVVVQPAPANASGWQPALAWTAYLMANPTTTPKDVVRVRQAIRELPDERSRYLIRMSDRPDVEGHVASHLGILLGPPEVWLSRKGSNYRSGKALRLAGTIVHESAHLEGASELVARERQLDFLRKALASGRGWGLRGYVRSLREELERREYLFQRNPGMAHLGEPMVRR